jgi:pimeloyl-ACP methyl ester carboxylesterase
MSSGIKNIVLVHGNFADGSGWESVFQILQKDGYNPTIVQNPTLSLAQDIALTKHAIASAPGEVILAGHSYGGAVVTEAGTDPKVAGLVYITAFAPDTGVCFQPDRQRASGSSGPANSASGGRIAVPGQG